MSDIGMVRQGQPSARGAIDWVRAVFTGACLSGAFWAIVARLTIFSAQADAAVTLSWVVLTVGCLALIGGGSALAYWGGSGRLRTAGVAMGIAAVNGLLVVIPGTIVVLLQ